MPSRIVGSTNIYPNSLFCNKIHPNCWKIGNWFYQTPKRNSAVLFPAPITSSMYFYFIRRFSGIDIHGFIDSHQSLATRCLVDGKADRAILGWSQARLHILHSPPPYMGRIGIICRRSIITLCIGPGPRYTDDSSTEGLLNPEQMPWHVDMGTWDR